MAKAIRPEGRQPVAPVEQDAVRVGRLILAPRFIAVGGEADVGVGDIGEGGVEVLLAVPRDIGQGGRCLT